MEGAYLDHESATPVRKEDFESKQYLRGPSEPLKRNLTQRRKVAKIK